jgi:hypothetical protein
MAFIKRRDSLLLLAAGVELKAVRRGAHGEWKANTKGYRPNEDSRIGSLATISNEEGSEN